MKHKINTIEEAREFLFSLMTAPLQLRQIELCKIVLDDPRFWEWPAAVKKHHAFNGGLAIHTAQVLCTALDMVKSIPGAKLDLIIVAGIWHDYCKCDSYIKDPKSESGWNYDPYSFKIGHLAGSYGEFCKVGSKYMTDYAVEEVGHIMLSHHGRNEWGSPVEPKTVEAWALHAGDMMSSHFVENYYLNR